MGASSVRRQQYMDVPVDVTQASAEENPERLDVFLNVSHKVLVLRHSFCDPPCSAGAHEVLDDITRSRLCRPVLPALLLSKRALMNPFSS